MMNYLIFLIILKIILPIPYCKEGQNFCSKCNPQKTLCIKCEKKELFNLNDKGECVLSRKCNVGKNNCLECSEKGNLCKICENDYYPDDNGGCSYTNNCEVSERGRCLKCKKNYILIWVNNYFNDGIKICKSNNTEDLKYCLRIDIESGTCLRCINGYYLGNEDKKCTNIQYCIESVQGKCKKCEKNYYLDRKENKCKEQNESFIFCQESNDGQKCDLCEIGYYFDEYGKCNNLNYCLEGNKLGKCKKCLNGYFFSSNGNSCTPEKNCFSGNKDFGVCDSCYYNYYIDLKDRKCKSNQEENNFKFCRLADGECKQCIYGYHIGEDHKCSTSIECVESKNGICIKCKENYNLGLDNKCTNIEHCIYSSYYGQCYECDKNYYYNSQNKTCLIAKDNLDNCKESFDGIHCQKCKNDFYLNQTDFLCYSNLKNNDYYKCSIISDPEEHCLICIEGYYLGKKDSKCSKIEGCILSENENRCLECDINFCLNVKTGKCESNNDIYLEEEKFYYRCNRTNEEGNACEICIDNYTLNENGLCIDYSHCFEKKEGVCQKCQNEINSNFCLNNNFGCVNVFSEGCLECNNFLDFYNCTKCLEGYELNWNNICIKIEE